MPTNDEMEPTHDPVIPNFHVKAVKNNKRSKQEGRPVYENREYVEMLIPGNTTEIPCMPVRQEHIDRWPQQYQRFQQKREQVADGTPLEQWPIMDPARISALKDAHIYTVDQLANLPDSYSKSVGPDFHELRKAANRFLKAAQETADEGRVEELEAENQQLRDRIAEMEQEMEHLRANQKKAPGRPRKRQQQDSEQGELA